MKTHVWVLAFFAAGVFAGNATHVVYDRATEEPDLGRCLELAGMVYGATVEATNDTLHARNTVDLWMVGLSFRDAEETPAERCEALFLDWCDDGGRGWCGRDFICESPLGLDCERRAPASQEGV